MWMEFARMRGTLHTGMRLERGFALLAWMVNQAAGGKAEFKDFAPHFDEAEVSLGEAMKTWS